MVSLVAVTATLDRVYSSSRPGVNHYNICELILGIRGASMVAPPDGIQGFNDAWDALSTIISSARNALTDVLIPVVQVTADDPALAQFDVIAAEAKRLNLGFGSVVSLDDLPCPPAAVGIYLSGVLKRWDGYRPNWRSLTQDLGTLYTVTTKLAGEAVPHAERVHACTNAVLELAVLWFAEQPDAEQMRAAAQSFAVLSRVLGDEGEPELAVPIAQSCRNILRLSGDEEAVAVFQPHVFRLVRATGWQDTLAEELALHADTSARLALTRPNRMREAFDACEAAIRHLLATGQRPEYSMSLMHELVSQLPDLQPLWSLVELLKPAEERQAKHAALLASIGPVLNPIRCESYAEWVSEGFMMSGAFCMAVENRRLELDRPPDRLAALVDWADWTFTHPNLLRAVPNGSSFLKEADRDELLLVLNHEVTHVLSLAGIVGTATFALRLAAYEVELELLAATTAATPLGALTADPPDAQLRALIRDRMATQLDDRRSARTLALVERQLEIVRKWQILEACWTPWFEGVAVFGEVSTDPGTDRLRIVPSIEVALDLWDEAILKADEPMPSEEVIQERLAQRWTRAEQLYADARQKQGTPRLRTYLGRYPSKYLAGYLAVRGVVAVWRATVDRPLSGAEVFAILLHATRYADADKAVPPLDLPLDEFEKAAIAWHTDWVGSLARFSREDLETTLGHAAPDNSLQWENGRLVIGRRSDAETQTQIEDRLRRWHRTAYRSLFGPATRPARVGPASDECYDLLRNVADAYAASEREPRFADPAISAALLNGLLALPLGQADCPFWVLRDRWVDVLIRARERDPETDRPSYNRLAIPLGDEPFAHLLREARRTGDHRMRVTRVAVLAGEDGHSSRQVLVFQLGEWLHCRNCGKYIEAGDVPPEVVEVVRTRLAANPAVTHFRWLTGKASPCAERAARYAANAGWGATAGKPDLSPWAGYVGRLAADSGSKAVVGQTVARASAALFAVTFGPTEGERVAAALGSLHEDDSPAFGRVVEALEQTACAPSPESPALSAAVTTCREIGIPLFDKSARGWDVARPPAGEEGSR